MVRMLITDDHEVVRRGLKLILIEGFRGAQIGEIGRASCRERVSVVV